MFKGFWGAALSVAGLAAVGLFVFYKLYDRICSPRHGEGVSGSFG